MEKILKGYDPKLFWPVLTFFLIILICAVAFPKETEKTFITARNFMIFNFSWAILLGVGFTLFFCIYLIFSPYADIKLGKEDDIPDFSFSAWIAMLFSCGLGIGFVFYSVTEPLIHLYKAPYIADAGLTGTAAGIPRAIHLTLLDWGLHGWALFVVAGWAIAYPAYRLGKPMTVATGLYGILGDRCNSSIWGRLADGLGALGTIGGTATMMGLGVASISFGINQIFGVQLDNVGKIILMLFLIAAYVISAASGVEKGIKILSQTNMTLAGILLLIILFWGPAPTNYLLNMITQMTGDYVTKLVEFSFWSDVEGLKQREWLGWWVVFYWLWYISYIPFCGGFIARISRGRTLKEFVVGVMVVPMILTVLWFCIWGGSATYADVSGIVPLWEKVQLNNEAGIYLLLGSMKGGWWLSLIVLTNLIIFAVTTADSASFFIAMQMTKGSFNPSIAMRLLWGAIIGLTGILFQLTGGFAAIKSLAIVLGGPFFFVSIAFIVSTYKMLKMTRENRFN
ncbi:BCCT family transporter [Desulfocicer vacuolatum]|nr:BCCT family transporter [Desulfocicer vacuolatum]